MSPRTGSNLNRPWLGHTYETLLSQSPLPPTIKREAPEWDRFGACWRGTPTHSRDATGGSPDTPELNAPASFAKKKRVCCGPVEDCALRVGGPRPQKTEDNTIERPPQQER